jgi:hypothetical protein
VKFKYLFKARPTAESSRCGRPGTIYPLVVLNAEGEDADIISELYGINAYVDHRSLYQALQFGLVNPNSKIGLDSSWSSWLTQSWRPCRKVLWN